MKTKLFNKKGNLTAAIGIGALLIFLIYSTWIISRPKPIEVQGGRVIGELQSEPEAEHRADYRAKP